MMNCFCEMVDQWKVSSLISSQDYVQIFSPLQISYMPQAGLCKNLSSDFIEWNGAVLITTTTLLENFKDNLDVCYLPIWDLKHFCSSLYSFVKIISSFKCNISVSTSRSLAHKCKNNFGYLICVSITKMKLNYVNQTLRVHIKYVALYNMIHDGRLFGFEEHNEECLFS